MNAKRALAWTFGIGLAGYAGMWYFMGRVEVLSRASEYLAMVFFTGALAVALLAPVAMRSDRRWLRRTAALLVWPVLALAGQEGWEMYVDGNPNLPAGGAEIVLILALIGGILSWRAADADARRWMLYGVPLLVLAPMALMDNIHYAMVVGQALSLVVVVGLVLEVWTKQVDEVDGAGDDADRLGPA